MISGRDIPLASPRQACPRGKLGALIIVVSAFASAPLHRASGQPSEDVTVACGRAAARAERDWHSPAGLLAAIGMVESGRRAPAGMFRVIWPWTINAEGRGFYQPSKAAAIGVVRGLQLRGVRVIDVGCFQVNLFYHPYAFASLEEAFEPDANAGAAARILSLGRFGSTGWDGAIAAYHSAWPLIGAVYLQKVRAVWPWIAARPSWGEPEPVAAYAVLLSPQARLVRVLTPFDPDPKQPARLPRLLSDEGPANETVQWLQQPAAKLPCVLTPEAVRPTRFSTLAAYPR